MSRSDMSIVSGLALLLVIVLLVIPGSMSQSLLADERRTPSSIGDGLAVTNSNSRSGELVNVEEPIDFSDIPYPDPYPNPNIDHDAIINQNVPKQDDTTEEEGLEQSQVKPPLRMPPDQSKSKSDLEPEEEPLLIPDWNPDESHETILWKRIMAEKKQRQVEYQIIQREREMLERERRQLAQLKEQPLNGDNRW